MRTLLIGLSSIGARRVLPALGAIEEVEAVDIASAGKAPPLEWPKRGRFFNSYAEALEESQAELVYISLPNAHHERWVLKALVCGKHVIVDKPAAMTLGGARSCLEAAASRSLLLAEATVFAHHHHIPALLDFLAANGPLTHLDALFIIPPLPNENFRNSLKLGGGCVLDMGPYAAALARLFGDQLEALWVLPAKPSPSREVDVGFSLAASFANGLRYTGHFSFESEYQNRLTAIGEGGSVIVDRVFSPPSDVPLTWHVRRQNRAEEIAQPAADMFRIFLERVLQAIRSRDFDRFSSVLLQDAIFRARIDDALERGPAHD